MDTLTFATVAAHIGVDPETLVQQYYQQLSGIAWQPRNMPSDEQREAMQQKWLKARMDSYELQH